MLATNLESLNRTYQLAHSAPYSSCSTSSMFVLFPTRYYQF